MDTKTPEERSRNMAAVKSKNTGPEVILRRALWHAGLRFFTAAGWHRLSSVRLPGSPDIVFPSARVVVFVDGCFWHGCPQHYQAPADRAQFWSNKLAINRERDIRATQGLEQQGWIVLRVWEHDVRKQVLPTTVERLSAAIKAGTHAATKVAVTRQTPVTE